MRDSIYTIPITDVFTTKCGCPICSIKQMLQDRCIDYIMGAAMMEPDVRINTNTFGFCYSHLNIMFNYNKKLSLALLLETHLDKLITDDFNKKNGADSCFVCNEINRNLEKICTNIIHLYSQNAEFKSLFNQQEFFCLNHYNYLCSLAKKALRKKDFLPFKQDLTNITLKYTKNLCENVHSFSKSFDYQNAGQTPTESVKKSLENAITFLK